MNDTIMEAGKKTILMVEDEVLIALSQKLTLEKFAYQVITCESGEKAVSMVRSMPEIELILMDINLGRGIDGTQAAEQILQIRQVPIVFLSSHSEPEIVAKTEKINSYGFVVKNSSITVLNTSIRQAFKLFEVNQQLKSTQARLDNVLHTIPEFILLVDANFTITFVNRTYPGIMNGQVVGSSVLDWIQPEYRKLYGEMLVTALKTRQYQEIETIGFGQNNEPAWYQSAVSPVIEDNRVTSLVMVGTDITVRKNRERALADKVESYRLAVNATLDGIWDWDILTNGEYFSPRWCEIIGYAADDPNLKHTYDEWFSRIHPDDRPKVTAALQRHLAGNGDYNVEYRHLHKSGMYRWQVSIGQALFDPSGKPYRMVGFIRDISELKETKVRLQASEDRLRACFEHVAEGLVVISADRDIIDANPAACAMFGYQRAEFLELKTEALLAPECKGSIKTGIDAIGASGTWTGESRFVREGGVTFTGTLRASSCGPDRFILFLTELAGQA